MHSREFLQKGTKETKIEEETFTEGSEENED